MTKIDPTPPRSGEPPSSAKASEDRLETAEAFEAALRYRYHTVLERLVKIEQRDAAMKLAGEAEGMEKAARIADRCSPIIAAAIRASQAPQDEGGTE